MMASGKTILLLLSSLVQYVSSDFFANVSFPGCMRFSTDYAILSATIRVNNENGYVFSALYTSQDDALDTSQKYTNRITNYEANRTVGLVSFCIINTTQYDGGNYTLTSTLTVSKPVVKRLYILDKPEKAEIRIMRDGIVNTQPALIWCQVKSTSVPSGLLFTYTWILNDTQISGANGSEIYMNVTRVDRFNNYRCFGKERYGQTSDVSAVANLDPKVLVSAVTISPAGDEFNVTEGENSTFTCTTNYSRPAAWIYWYVGGHNMKNQTISQPLTLDPDLFITSSTLIYSGDDSDHNKTIYCESMNIPNWTVKSEIKYIFINVPVKKVTITPPGDNRVISIVEGDKISFNCTTDPSRPAALIFWYIGGNNVTNQAILLPSSTIGDKFISSSNFIYTGKDTDHNKTIHCEAVSVQDRKIKSDMAYIFIKVPVEKVTITPPGDNSVINVVKGDQNAFNCTTYPSRPAALIRWYIGGNDVTNQATSHALNIIGDKFISSSNFIYTGNVTHHNKTIYCQADNIEGRQGVQSLIIIIFIQVPVTKVTITPTGYNSTVDVIENKNQTFICSTDYSRPVASIQWYLGGDNVTDRATPKPPHQDGDMFISSSQLIYIGKEKDHSRIIYCTAVNIAAQQNVESDAKSLYIKVKPRNIALQPPTSRYQIQETESINVVICTAFCRPECKYYWKGPNNFTLPIVNLTLGSIYRNKSGIYYCYGENELGIIYSDGVTIEVYYPPYIRSLTTYNSTTVDENATAFFQCNVDSHPEPIIQWKVRENVVHTDVHVLESNYTIYRTECSQTGTYVCQAANIINNTNMVSSKGIQFYVQCSVRPNINEVSTPSTIGIKPDDGLNITVYLISFPKPCIKWTFMSNLTGNYSSLNSTDTFGDFKHVSSLQRVNMSQDDFGIYKVTAYNNIGGIYTRTFIVIPERSPNPPTNISADCDVLSLTIIWKSEFNGGNTQIFRVIWWDNQQNEEKASEKIADPGEGIYLKYRVRNLQPATFYFVKIEANNSFGSVFSTEHVHCTTKAKSTETSDTASLGAGIGSATALIIIIMIGLGIFIRRRKLNQGSDENSRKSLTTAKKDEIDEDGLKDNVLYQSAGPNYKQEKDDSGSEYAAVQKKRSQLNDNNVQETALYSEVKGKSNKKPQGDGYSNSKKTKTKVNEKTSKQSEDVYQNIVIADNSNPIIVPKENKNKDGLQYAELVFNPVSNGSKFVIRGIEDRTIYATVDTTQNIDPLPDSDDEDIGKNSILEQR